MHCSVNPKSLLLHKPCDMQHFCLTVFLTSKMIIMLLMHTYIDQHILMTSYLTMDSFLCTFLFFSNFKIIHRKVASSKNPHIPLTQIPPFLAGNHFCFQCIIFLKVSPHICGNGSFQKTRGK